MVSLLSIRFPFTATVARCCCCCPFQSSTGNSTLKSNETLTEINNYPPVHVLYKHESIIIKIFNNTWIYKNLFFFWCSLLFLQFLKIYIDIVRGLIMSFIWVSDTCRLIFATRNYIFLSLRKINQNPLKREILIGLCRSLKINVRLINFHEDFSFRINCKNLLVKNSHETVDWWRISRSNLPPLPFPPSWYLKI